MKNPYVPELAVIEDIIEETAANDVKTFRVVFCDANTRRDFSYRPGQFAEVSVFGLGEAPISITSSPTQAGYLEFAVKKAGVLTTALHEAEKGDCIGVRGPYGNVFPVEIMAGKHLVFIAGGIGLAPLRSLFNYCIDPSQRCQFKTVTMLYGARSPGDLVFKWELEKWGARPDLTQHITVDRGDGKWPGRVGFVPSLLMDVKPSPQETVAITCGPPIMIKYVLQNLEELGFAPEQIVTTLEMRMKCGIGKCGRCNIGAQYVCMDGPVFTYAQLRHMPKEY